MDASLDYLGSIDNRPPATDFVRNGPLDLTDDGLGAERTLDLFAQRYGRAMPASSGPRFWGFVTGGTTPAALVGDWWVARGAGHGGPGFRATPPERQRLVIEEAQPRSTTTHGGRHRPTASVGPVAGAN
ncbi:MAG: hypothetical protein P9F19_10745 [Candidatus Contendobacter sp.]|nr:hypothetical protein [Candidatus Contendobacter sp.]MDG4557846.1 hypothetical protein [Candidatus Contendobacter sp.]